VVLDEGLDVGIPDATIPVDVQFVETGRELSTAKCG
jgi:hypothetical protein